MIIIPPPNQLKGNRRRSAENEKSISGAIKVNKKEVMEHLDGLVRKSVEDTLNTLLNEEADAICNAGRYQRNPDRQDTRAGTYKRKFLTTSGEVELKIPRFRTLPFKELILRKKLVYNATFQLFL